MQLVNQLLDQTGKVCCLYLGVQLVPPCLLCLEVPPSLGVLQDPEVQAHLSLHGDPVDQVDLEEKNI